MNKLNKTILRSGFWFSFSSLLSVMLGFLQAFFLAIFFSRNDYGLYSLIFLIITMFDSFSEFGIKDALIRQKKTGDKILYTAFWMEFSRNIMCFLVLIFSAKFLSEFYNNERLYSFIIIISFRFIFNSLKNVNLFKLYTKFETKKLVFVQQLPIIITNFLSILVAYYTKNVLYVCYVIILGDFLSLIFSYFFYPKIPKFIFSYIDFKKLFKFCIHIFILTTLGYLLRQVDNLFISKFIGIIELGLYALAYKITNIVITNVSYVLNNIAYPLYTQIDDNGKNKYFKLFNELVINIYILFMFIVIVYFKQVILIIYGNKWSGLYELICSLLVFAFFRTIASLQGGIYKAKNKPQIDNILCVIELSIILITIYPLFKIFSIYGVVISLTISIFIRFIISTFYISKLIQYNYIKQFSYKNNFILIGYSILFNYVLISFMNKNLFWIIFDVLLYVIGYLFILYVLEKEKLKFLITIRKRS